MNLTGNENQNFTQRLLVICALVTLIILSVLAIIYVFDVVLLLFGAILLAIFLHGLANIVRRYGRISEGKSVLLVSFILLLVLGVSVWLLAPSVAEQVQKLRVDLPISMQKAGAYISNFGWGRSIIEQMPSTDELTEKINDSSFLSRLGGFFSTTIGALTNFS